MLRTGRSRITGARSGHLRHRRFEPDEILEKEFAAWLQVRELRTLCEMFAAALAEQFGLERSAFIRCRQLDAVPEAVYSRGVAGDTLQAILTDHALPDESLPNRAQQKRLEHSDHKMVTQRFSLDMDASRGLRTVVLVGTKNDKELTAEQKYRLELWMARFELALQNHERIACLEALSYTDSLTGLFNRRFFERRLGEEITRAGRFSRSLALVIFDLDSFKQLNDYRGHLAGDRMLKETADLLAQTVRSIDVACRYGGDEFVIIMPETSLPNCFSFTNRLRCVIFEHTFRPGPGPETAQLSISLGAAIFPDHAGDAERLFWCADMALLKAKEGGGDRAVIFQPGMDVVPATGDRR